MKESPLVSTQWLLEHLNAPDIVILDGSWYLPTVDRDPRAEYDACHIPGALFFDIDAIADTTSDLPHMLPSAPAFSAMMRKMGIGDGQRIIVYDHPGMQSVARVWWTFRAMGVEEVYVLDGGLTAWLEEGRPVSDEQPISRKERHFSARLSHSAVRDLDDMRKAVRKGAPLILDARPTGRFTGEAPEPRAGLRSGHMPGSVSLPHASLLENGRFKDRDTLKTLFDDAGVKPGEPVVTTCGSGVTACVLALGLELIGHMNTGVYDGSWSEWGSLKDTPVTLEN